MKATVKGVKKCAEWLAFCLSIGYKKEELDALENVFWMFRDRNGNLKRATEK
jgi:hypothetical protein